MKRRGAKGSKKPARKQGRGHGGRGRRPEVGVGQRRRAHAFVESAPDAVKETVGGGGAQGTRLNRWLAERGVASRRKSDELVIGGAVEVNGEIVLEPGRRIRPGDVVRVNGQPVKDVRKLYYLFHKPKGVLCTEDPRERRTRVCDLVDPLVPGRVFTVGRLDEDSEGLLLLTNDGDFANQVAHPRYGVPKTYMVQVQGAVDRDTIAKLRKGVYLSDGKAVPLSVRVAKRGKVTTTLEVHMREGRNREVRRILARVGLGVKALKRVRIGELGIRGVARGGLRPVTKAERDALLRTAGGAPPTADRGATDRAERDEEVH